MVEWEALGEPPKPPTKEELKRDFELVKRKSRTSNAFEFKDENELLEFHKLIDDHISKIMAGSNESPTEISPLPIPELHETSWLRFDKAWNTYFYNHIIKNEHLRKILKHAFIGTIIPTTFYFGGKEISGRMPVFMIQNSGSAKSEAMKLVHKLLMACGKRSFYILKVTDAKLTGSVDAPKNKEGAIRTPGLLEEYDAIFWDEGSILLKQGPYSETLADILQMALDDPGRVSRALKYGTVEYDTNTNVVSGSYIVPQMGEIVINRGLFQRFYLVFKKVSNEELKAIDDEFDRLFFSPPQANINEINIMRELLRNLPSYIAINENDAKRFHNDILKPLRDQHLFEQYTDIKEEILKSFWFRLRMKGMKFAMHYAVLNGKTEIDYESLVYGADFMKDELNYVKQILETTVIEISKQVINRESIVLDKLQQPLERQQLLVALEEHHRWDLGYNRTLEFINDMEVKKQISVDRSKKPHIYSLFI